MLNRFVSALKGCVASVVLVANAVILCSAMMPFALLKLALPFKPVRIATDAVLNKLAGIWVSINNIWISLVQPKPWQVNVSAQLRRGGWYLVSANHQSWVDILVLQRVFNGVNGRVPLLKFFIKRELIYVPVMGLAWWALDFPFLRRQTNRRSVAKDLAAARKSCEKFRLIPTSVISFMEGTRFSPTKKQEQQSPYRHLLKPKMGGISMALSTMGDQFDSMLDVTIVYPGGIPSFWDLLSGRLQDVVVQVREVPIPQEFCKGSATFDAGYRASLQAWISDLWAEKDRRIDELLAQFQRDAAAAQRA